MSCCTEDSTRFDVNFEGSLDEREYSSGSEVYYQYVLELQERLQDTCAVAKQELKISQGKQKKHFEVKSRTRGDRLSEGCA